MAPLPSESQNRQLAEYIKRNLAKKYTPDTLRYSLMSQGYSRTTVEKAFEIAQKDIAKESRSMNEKPIIRYVEIDQDEIRKKVEEQDSSRGFFSRIWGKIWG